MGRNTEKKIHRIEDGKKTPCLQPGKNENAESTSSKLGIVMFAPPPNGQIEHGQIPPCCSASLTGSKHKPFTCCPRYLFQDHQAKKDKVFVACSFFHVTEDGSELPTAHASHKNA